MQLDREEPAQVVKRSPQLPVEEVEAVAAADKESWPLGAAAAGGPCAV